MTRRDFDIHDRPPMDPKAALAHLRFRLGNPVALRDPQGLEAIETVRWLIETNAELRYAADAEFHPREKQKIAKIRAAFPDVGNPRAPAITGAKVLYLLYRERKRTRGGINTDFIHEYISESRTDNTQIVNVYVCKLRRALQIVLPDCPYRGIINEWGVGYKISDAGAVWVASVLGDTPPAGTETQP